MDYKKIHNSIINNAKLQNRNKKSGEYFESHHILPKSLGGDNLKNNKVLLTAREHFVIHKCLVLIYKKIDKNAYHKMNHALHRFLYSKNSNTYKINSRDYEKIKMSHAKSMSYHNKGRKFSEKAKLNMSIAQRKIFENTPGYFTGKKHSKETKVKMSQKQAGKNNPQFNKPRTDEEKEKISNTMKGVKKSPETITKFKKRILSEKTKQQISEGLKKYHATKRNKNS